MEILKTILFETEEEFVKHVNSKGDLTGKEDTISHERSHFNMAAELGYNPHYCFREIAFRDFLGNVLPMSTYWTEFNYEDNLNPTNLRKICLAPENPSYLDKRYGRFPTFYTLLLKIKGELSKIKLTI